MQINVKGLSHEEIIAKVHELLLSELNSAKEKFPKVVKKNALMAEQLEKITKDSIKIRCFAGRRIVDMEMDLDRYYVFSSHISGEDMLGYLRDGTLDNVKHYKDETVTVTLKGLGIDTPVISVYNCNARDIAIYKSQIESTVAKFYPGTVWLNYNDTPSCSNMFYSIRERYMEIFSEVNKTRLYNHPQKTMSIDISNMIPLEEEKFQGDIYGVAVELVSKDNSSLMMRIAEYNEESGLLNLRPIEEILASRAASESGNWYKVSERVEPTKAGAIFATILEKIGEILKGGFKMFLDSFNKR